ncbi:hypothetical protein NPIL_98041 [Nephila pilipes]|uniref:Uncharacterized protein n=1 Tax=Nephila pilipes TaxID=299642 RepID=A0A8X6PFE7_NEPPI|nr:hypothetical protein NPIL_98041 [Nephila pilipes]
MFRHRTFRWTLSTLYQNLQPPAEKIPSTFLSSPLPSHLVWLVDMQALGRFTSKRKKCQLIAKINSISEKANRQIVFLSIPACVDDGSRLPRHRTFRWTLSTLYQNLQLPAEKIPSAFSELSSPLLSCVVGGHASPWPVYY